MRAFCSNEQACGRGFADARSCSWYPGKDPRTPPRHHLSGHCVWSTQPWRATGVRTQHENNPGGNAGTSACDDAPSGAAEVVSGAPGSGGEVAGISTKAHRTQPPKRKRSSPLLRIGNDGHVRPTKVQLKLTEFGMAANKASKAACCQLDKPEEVFVCPVACCERTFGTRAGMLSHLRSGSDRHRAAVEKLASDSNKGAAAFWKRLGSRGSPVVSIAEPLTAIPVNSVVPATQEKLGRLEQAGEKKRDKRSGNRGAATRRSYTAEFKLMVLQAAADTSPAAAARKYKVSASNISKWAKTSELQCGGVDLLPAHTPTWLESVPCTQRTRLRHVRRQHAV